MPRGVRKAVDYDSEIAKIDEKIEKQNKNIEALKAQKKELISKKQDAAMKVIYDFMEKEGKTAVEILDMVKNTGK